MPMRTFTLYVHDGRYSVPNLVFASAADPDLARGIAASELNRSEHHLAVDVREADAWLFRVKRSDQRSFTLPMDSSIQSSA
jgi:hypothetical protein